MRPDEYQRFDALGLAELVQTGQVTPTELLDAATRQAEAVNPALNAIVRPMQTQARERVNHELTGPFAGVPFLVKDLAQDVAGLPSSSGSASLATTPVTEHSTVVQRWLDAGLVIFGKTNTPEFGAKGITEPELFGPAHNPWDLGRTPGGSSGGSAAAVAAGIVPVAGANDGGGSIRIPAACCGLVGLKPSRGLLPMGPALGEMMHGAAVQGVVSRSVRDTAAMLDVLEGGETSGPFQPAIPDESFLSRLDDAPRGLRIGLCVKSSINPNPHPESVAAVEATAKTLEDLGHHVDILDSPPFDDEALARDFLLTWFVVLAWDLDEAKRRTGCSEDSFEFDTRIIAAIGRATPSVDYVDAVARRHDHTRRLSTYFETYDLLLTPTLADLPPRIGELDTPMLARRAGSLLLKTRTAGFLRHAPLVEQMIDKNLRWVPYTQLANLTGRPALTVPMHWTPDGLPMGAQFTGQLGDEALLLQLAAQLEQARPWFDRRPQISKTV
ncbi:MAG: amidase family protein [Rhodococcus sp. (in: high G+C Gram-positive bacteria)]